MVPLVPLVWFLWFLWFLWSGSYGSSSSSSSYGSSGLVPLVPLVPGHDQSPGTVSLSLRLPFSPSPPVKTLLSSSVYLSSPPPSTSPLLLRLPLLSSSSPPFLCLLSLTASQTPVCQSDDPEIWRGSAPHGQAGTHTLLERTHLERTRASTAPHRHAKAHTLESHTLGARGEREEEGGGLP